MTSNRCTLWYHVILGKTSVLTVGLCDCDVVAARRRRCRSTVSTVRAGTVRAGGAGTISGRRVAEVRGGTEATAGS